MINVSIQFFGSLRDWNTKSSVTFKVPLGLKVNELRTLVAQEMKAQGADHRSLEILNASVFATEETTLTEDSILSGDGVLVVLPPVCGG